MDKDKIIRSGYERGLPIAEIAQEVGIHRSNVIYRAKKMGLTHPNRFNAIMGGGSSLTKEAIMPTEEQTRALLDECMKYGIDPNAVKYYWHKSKRLSAFVVTDQRPTYEQIRDAVIADMKKYRPSYPKARRSVIKDPHLLVVDPADIHVGKYSVKSETGYDYDMKLAVKRAEEGVAGILQKAQGYPVDQILLVVGNDVLHRDNSQNTTTSGTRQDVDGMWHEAFTAARKMYVRIIESLVPHANVHVVFNPSNHDYVSGYMLVDALQCWFNSSKQVTFDCAIRHRKYYKYGANLIATTHGDGAKNADMPLLMAQEAPQLWGETVHRYIYQHHLHHRTKVNWQSVKDYPGITLQILRSPSPPDAWHAKQGFTGAPQAIEGFIHHKTGGQVACLSHIF